ncbi:hypothetical protein TrVFT333_002465 [Trichoderma virens FT-333]|nr:hypothetical protein TrVFT333_002465 [Trichoderma virens FT-333]
MYKVEIGVENQSGGRSWAKRRAQNQAAQKAFRDLKKQHIINLESEIASLKAAQEEAANENQRLRQDLLKISTENELLRASSTRGINFYQCSHSPKPINLYTNVRQDQKNKCPSQCTVTFGDNHWLFADYIIPHDLCCGEPEGHGGGHDDRSSQANNRKRKLR